MIKSRDHIYCISSVISALFSAIHYNSCRKDVHKVIVIIDRISMEEDQHYYIYKTLKLIPDCIIIDLSTKPKRKDAKVPTQLKHLTRSLKTKPILKQTYNFLYTFVERNRKNKIADLLTSKMIDVSKEAYLFTQPKLLLNLAIKKLLPYATIKYIEHGLGDYIDLLKVLNQNNQFHCLFSEEWNQYQKIVSKPLFQKHDFDNLSNQFENHYPEVNKLLPFINGFDKIHLICLQSFEQFRVPGAYWEEYIDHVVKKCKPDSKSIFVIKPHHYQTDISIKIIKRTLENLSLPFFIINHSHIGALSIEIIFWFFKRDVISVHSPFSSSLFYLSKLYPKSAIDYFYDFNILRSYTDEVPQLYIERWAKLEELVQNVFGLRCSSLT